MLTQLKKVFIKIPIYYFIILIIAIVLRFWHVDNHGLFMYDDARLMHFTQTIVLFFKTGTVPVQPEFFSSAKPGSIFPFVLTALIFSQPTDLLFSQFTAFFSVCVVVLTMVVTKALFKSNLSALCAGLISALSPLQLYFSKFNVGGSLAMLFTLIGLYLYIRYFKKNSLKNLIFLGFVLGYGFTINYSILPFLLLIAILAIVRILRSQPKVHLFLFSASCLFFPIIFQVGYELLQLSDNRFPTYFTMLGNHREAILSDRQIYLDPLYYFNLFIKYDAVSFILAMLGISLIYKKIKSTGNNIAIIFANIALLLLLSLSVSTAFLVSVPRTAYMLVAILPIFGSLAITWALDVIGPIFLRCCKTVRILLGTGVFILGGGLLFGGLQSIISIQNLQSGYKQAAIWMNGQPGKSACYIHCYILALYSDKFISKLNPSNENIEFNHVIVDYADRYLLGNMNFMNFGKFKNDRSYILMLDNSHNPLIVFNNSIGASELFSMEQGGGRKPPVENQERILNGKLVMYLVN